MRDLVSRLLDGYSDLAFTQANVIPWSCPVPVFGNLSTSYVGTLGLNPSNREFVDVFGNELVGRDRRFETLNSLKLTRWSDARISHIRRLWNACQTYFSNNPYDQWFRKLDVLISDTRASYYFATASHLDLIPYATACKWGQLSQMQKQLLLNASGNSLALSLCQSGIRLLVLNGASVVSLFQSMFGVKLEQQRMDDWTLRSRGAARVAGYSYVGSVSSLAGISLDRTVTVVGFNHNIQSSFGVTREVTDSIRLWIGQVGEEAFA
jgi:hypothetical protein